MALAARGMTTLVASGDGGAAGFGKEDDCTVFHPTFPSTCPYITSVGGTTLTENSSETGVSFSSGGFSNLFPQPSYQTNSVNQFLSHIGDSNAGLFNQTGRAYPDISAISNNIIFIFQNGRSVSGMGTSFSSPVVASVVAFLNAHRKANGKPTLGFLNPAIYQNQGALNDITGGNNTGCNSTGFMATNGWDAVCIAVADLSYGFLVLIMIVKGYWPRYSQLRLPGQCLRVVKCIRYLVQCLNLSCRERS